MTLAFVFDSVGAGEWLMLLAVLLVVIGPKRLPGVLRKFGNQYAKFRRAAESFKRQLMEMDTEFERAVDSAAREAEEAAKIPDFEDPASEPAEAPSTAPNEDYPLEYPVQEPEPEPAEATAETPAEVPAEAPAESTDGNQPA